MPPATGVVSRSMPLKVVLSEGACLPAGGAGDTGRLLAGTDLRSERVHVSKERLLEASLTLWRELGDKGRRHTEAAPW